MRTSAVWGVFVGQAGEWGGTKGDCTTWDWGAQVGEGE